jgi:hypothetical protein
MLAVKAMWYEMVANSDLVRPSARLYMLEYGPVPTERHQFEGQECIDEIRQKDEEAISDIELLL